MIDDSNVPAKDTWLQRARKHDVPLAASGREAMQSNATSTQGQNGWDPHDVWLSRIHEPRRRAAAATRR